MTPWSRQCLRQADAVLIIANGFSKPTIGLVENQLNNYSSRAIKILVLLHKATSKDSFVKIRSKVVWAFLLVIRSEFCMWQYRDDEPREDGSHFINRLLIYDKLLSHQKIHLVGCNCGHG